jgi:septal ring factor EnvC (AmiA/AmiB activator)
MLDAMKQRSQSIQTEIQQTNQNINVLRENLINSKNKLNQLIGHYNEVNFVLGELQKKEDCAEDKKADDQNSTDNTEVKDC